MKKLILAICLLLPSFAYSASTQKINFNEYKTALANLATQCASKNMPAFNGFCLSQKYDNQTTTSITVALALIAYEEFYKKCEHTDFSNRDDLLIHSMNIEETKKFYEDMKNQIEAIETYSGYFGFCRNKEENDAMISKKLKWFEYMIDKTSNYIKDKESGLYLFKKPKPL